ncbi:acid protease [Lophium mytilinum]|uniref:Acid protease n=1 Tax=Lophium mytilinum TaxID=390894 RepID=A0A6A6QWE6_9PEZI|nr:acid protease [Lophium mytilinum]
MMFNEACLVLFFALLPVCSGATAPIPIKRTTIRFKFDDWQMYTKHVGAFQEPEPFTASIDISWSDMFVPSAECLQDPATVPRCCTYHPNRTVTNVMYEGLSTSGHLSRDQLEEATFWRTMCLNAAPLHSALGLARLQIRTPASTAGTKSALRSMLDQKLLSRPVFSLRLPGRDDESGDLALGYIPSGVLAQSAVILPLIEATPPKELSQLAYYISSGYTVELESITIQSSPGSNPRMDDLLADLDCSMRDELPNIVFSFGKDAVIVRDIDKGMRCVLPFAYLQQSDDEEVVLGSAFMQGVYSAFDLENGEVSLAALGE